MYTLRQQIGLKPSEFLLGYQPLLKQLTEFGELINHRVLRLDGLILNPLRLWLGCLASKDPEDWGKPYPHRVGSFGGVVKKWLPPTWLERI